MARKVKSFNSTTFSFEFFNVVYAFFISVSYIQALPKIKSEYAVRKLEAYKAEFKKINIKIINKVICINIY